MRLIALFLLSACSFSPIYSKHSEEAAATASIVISTVKGYDGVAGINLRNNLYDKLTPRGIPDYPEYTLNVTLTEPATGNYTINQWGTATSYYISLTATYSLRLHSTGEVLFSKSANSKSTYNILQDQYSSETLKKQVETLVIKDLSEQIYLGTIAYFAKAEE